ncbi:iron complex transport system substrate-binding protein [Paracoccus alcaliphilus]|uniref:Iron complex transport system substrate-binding protein n=1 Tax=Paracoccus alcaliphilus TaxID=34002 RepID=A0A1H8F1C2_9RHOB|nr:ABC transporter substrate-binding protein [Paracoccus alcaliphilus]WCR20427.1 ABC transporter substrate-binding protein [Paracoccus alcaliphilus]SEN25525.1 iron complex transport system substrate-binding protein [Paracoccus alcaliphilus]
MGSGALLAAGLAPGVLRSAPAAPRLATIDWAMMETAIAIGHMPVAGCELIRYRADAVSPEIPDQVTDLGLRGAPNYELLQLTRPDLILSSPYYTRYEARLASIAPVLSLPFYLPGEAPLPRALSALDGLAAAIGDAGAGRDARAACEAEFDRLAGRLRPFADRPVCPVNLGDARHLRAFGNDSMFGNVLERLGLINAWTGGTRFSFLAPVPIEELARIPEARIAIVGAVPPEARRGLRRSVLWQALPAVAENRVFQLGRVNPFGGVPAGLRFARLLADAFTRAPQPVESIG